MGNTITIYGRIPSKKNSRRPFIRNGRIMNFPSKDYVAWQKDASKQLIGSPKITSDHLLLRFTFPDKRKTDLTNKAESVMDLLVDNGILEDDNWNVVTNLLLIGEGVDSKNPKCEIEW